MRPIGVHEHVGKELPRTEVAGKKEMQAEKFIEVYAVRTKSKTGKEAQHIDDEQVLGDGRYRIHL